jgi:hypothetical protein
MSLGYLLPGSFSVAKTYTVNMSVQKSSICSSGIYVVGWPAVPVVYSIIATCYASYELAVGVPACTCGVSEKSDLRRFIDSGAI